MGKDRIFGLDVMRAAAILMVVFGHLWWLLPDKNGISAQLASLGGFFGVELFFVLSGFLIGRILLRQFLESSLDKRTVFTFLKRRWLRTLPNYYLVLLINIALAFAFSSAVPNWRYFFFLQNFARPMTPFFTESWSLSVEEFAYLLLPIILVASVFAFGRKTLRVFTFSVLLLMLLGFVMRLFYHNSHPETILDQWNIGLKSVVIYRLDAIFTGVLAAILSVFFSGQWLRYRYFFAVIGFGIIGFLSVGIGFLQITYDRFPMFWNVFYLPITSVGFSCFLPLCANWKGGFVIRPVSFVSRISYAWYLVHYGIVLQCIKQIHLSSVLLQAILYLGMSIGLAHLLYAGFEKRFLEWRDRKLPQ